MQFMNAPIVRPNHGILLENLSGWNFPYIKDHGLRVPHITSVRVKNSVRHSSLDNMI